MKLSGFRFVIATALGLSLLTSTPAKAATEVPAAFNVSGSGFGHGVGMSQYGAFGMALEGYSYDQILTHYYTGTSVENFDFTTFATTRNGVQMSAGDIAVNVQGDDPFMYLRIEDNPAVATARVDAKLTIAIDGGAPFQITQDIIYTFTQTGTTFSLSDGTNTYTGTKAVITWDNDATLANVNYGIPGSDAAGMLGTCSTTSCPHRYKYGTFEIFVSAQKPDNSVTQDLQAVNILNLNRDYLYGLGEMPSSWGDTKQNGTSGMAALSAQAIAARTYALKKMKAYPASDRDDCGCQLFADTSDQNFVGFSKEYFASGTNWKNAVYETANSSATVGKIVTYQGQPIAGHYSSSTGGLTQPASEWTTTSYPYEVSVDDHWALVPGVNNPKASWNVTVDQTTLVTRLKNYGVPVTDIAAIAITGKYASGGVSQLTITDSLGTPLVIDVGPGKSITPDRLRTTFGAYSTYFSAVNVGVGVQPGTATPPPAKVKIKALTNVKWPATTILPGSTFVTGRVAPVQAGVQVDLQILQKNKWITVASDATGPQGIWKTTWSGISAGTYKMRIVAATPLNSLKTGTRSLKAIGSVAISGPKTVARNSTISIGGSVRPGIEGIPVTVQRRIGGAGWKTVATVVTDGAGNWGFSVNAGAKKTTNQFRIIVKDGRVGNLTSKVIKTTIK